jgi:hypothetical protein
MTNKTKLLIKYTLQQLELHSEIPPYLYTDESCILTYLVAHRMQFDKFSLIENYLNFFPQQNLLQRSRG